MGRLTKRTEKGGHAYFQYHEISFPDKYSRCFGSVAEKLADYEDAEEEEKLLWLPCKVGDILYVFSYGEIYSLEVRKIEINQYEKTLLLKYNGEREEMRFWEIRAPFSDVDVKYFRTKEEAEKALAERGK